LGKGRQESGDRRGGLDKKKLKKQRPECGGKRNRPVKSGRGVLRTRLMGRGGRQVRGVEGEEEGGCGRGWGGGEEAGTAHGSAKSEKMF